MSNKNVHKCSGCGVLLQSENMLDEGYVLNLGDKLCQRCFRMKNYGEYTVVAKSNEEYLDILESVGKTKDLVLYVTDLLNIEQDLLEIRKILSNKMILILNKKDVLPKSVKDEKLIEYFNQMNIFFEDIIVISVEKNYNIDTLMNLIKKNQTSKNVYVVGHTNAGKSTLINKLIKNYSLSTQELTISPLPSTTLNTVTINLDDHLTLIDTPGLVDPASIVNYASSAMLKKISPKKEIKPKTYQIKKGQSIIIEDIMRIDYKEGDKNSFTLYMSNALKVKRYLNSKHEDLKDLEKKSYDVKYKEDLVINGLGFVKIVDRCSIDIYIDSRVATFIRKSLI